MDGDRMGQQSEGSPGLVECAIYRHLDVHEKPDYDGAKQCTWRKSTAQENAVLTLK